MVYVLQCCSASCGVMRRQLLPVRKARCTKRVAHSTHLALRLIVGDELLQAVPFGRQVGDLCVT